MVAYNIFYLWLSVWGLVEQHAAEGTDLLSQLFLGLVGCDDYLLQLRELVFHFVVGYGYCLQ